jgi:hypothetical protein
MRLHSSKVRTTLGALALLAALAIVAARAAGASQDRPLPNKATFLEETKKRLKSDDRLLSQYTFRERQVRVDFNGDGRVEKKTTRVYEVYPSVEGSPSYRRLLSVNGVPEPAGRLADADRKQREKVQAWVRDRQSESPSAKNKREAKERRERDQEARIIDDIPRVYDIEVVGREELDGRPTIVLTLTPRPGVTPAVDDAAVMSKMKGRAWVDEQEFEVARVDLEAIDSINFGWGLFARIGKGSTLSFQRRKVNGEAWLPARMEVRPKARVALIKRIDADIVSEYGDYKKYTVETAIQFAVPKLK